MRIGKKIDLETLFERVSKGEEIEPIVFVGSKDSRYVFLSLTIFQKIVKSEILEESDEYEI